MGEIKGFLKVKRQGAKYRPVCERLKDYRDVSVVPQEGHTEDQTSRCMDCGTPFCHWGCPVGNYIPEWNDLVFRGHWQKALELLEATNNLPEITGRLCPAPCEYACVLGINDDPVTVRENELAIVEHGFKEGWIKPVPPLRHSGKKVAVVGSGPAGLSSAAQLNRLGHKVSVFERDNKIGGILRYGIPDFKLEKRILDRRIKIWEKEGVIFRTGITIGQDLKAAKLLADFDAVCLAAGSRVPRDLNIAGRALKGIHFAMDYLVQSNRRVCGEIIPKEELIDAKDKKVVVIGGGDTGADCVGTANRQGASCVVQIEIMPKPATCRTQEYPWPKYPLLFKTSTSHEEGAKRQWSVATKKFIGSGGILKAISCVEIEFAKDDKGCPLMKEVRGSGFEIEADLVILALGFLHPEKEGLVEELGLELDARGNIKTGADFMTSRKGVFSAGDMRRGQSLVVWAISEGRGAALCIDRYLNEQTIL
ncbi:MAG TPA: glutamate synthase subunit beta [Candidatus Margulisiibacteriota bacterium]|nr:glutamate synthase subunit beta [Candidatus Margulisiibacteriota bacterium]